MISWHTGSFKFLHISQIHSFNCTYVSVKSFSRIYRWLYLMIVCNCHCLHTNAIVSRTRKQGFRTVRPSCSEGSVILCSELLVMLVRPTCQDSRTVRSRLGLQGLHCPSCNQLESKHSIFCHVIFHFQSHTFCYPVPTLL